MPCPPQFAQVRSGVRHQREIGRARTVPLVAERVLLQRFVRVHPVLRQLLVGERDRSGDGFAGVGVLLCLVAAAVLDVRHLVLGPALLELAQDAAVIAGVAVAIVLAFPRDDGREVRRVHSRYAPLVARVIRNAEHADFAVAPRLRAGPFDALVEVLDLPGAAGVHEAGRPARTAGVHAHDGVAVRDPPFGIGGLPVLVLVGRAGQDLRMVGDHLLPLQRVSVLVREALAVDPVGQDHRAADIRDGPIHVRAKHEPVVHRDPLVPGDAHAVADFSALVGIRSDVHVVLRVDILKWPADYRGYWGCRPIARMSLPYFS